MKRQFDFITNSSSKSFIGFGVLIPIENFLHDEEFKQVREKIFSGEDEYEHLNGYEIILKINDLVNEDKDNHLDTFYSLNQSDCFLIGECVSFHFKNVKETVEEYENRVNNKLKAVGFPCNNFQAEYIHEIDDDF